MGEIYDQGRGSTQSEHPPNRPFAPNLSQVFLYWYSTLLDPGTITQHAQANIITLSEAFKASSECLEGAQN